MKDKKLYIRTLLLVLIIGIIIMGIQMFISGGFYVGVGDYYDQQIAFYKHAHNFIREGNWLWDWSSELGGEFIPTYAFYLVFSPFFLITLLFPSSFVIYLMPVLIILKMVLAGFTTILWLKPKIKNHNLICLGAVMYAFSGWMLDSIFFNHFLEVAAFFPLFLLVVENTLLGKNKYILIFFSAFMLLLNYYFFFGQIVFLLLYLIIKKWFDKGEVITYKNILITLFEGLLGVFLTSFVLLPIINVVVLNPRAINPIPLRQYFIYDNIQMYFSILESVISFPDSITYRGGLFKILEYGLPSQVLYVPILGAFLLPVFFKKSKEAWLKKLLITLLLFSFVPILNSSFSLFNVTYYARWFYIFSLFIILASIKVLDEFEWSDIKLELRRSVFLVIFVYLIIVGAGYLFNVRVNENAHWFNILFSVVTTLLSSLFVFISTITNDLYKYLKRMFLFGIISIIMFYSVSTLPSHSIRNEFIPRTRSDFLSVEAIDFKGDEFYRINSEYYLNTGLLHNKSSVSGYNSVISPSIFDFYKLLGFQREVKSNFIKVDSPLNNILSVKYLIDNNEVIENKEYLPVGIIFKNIEQVFDYKNASFSEEEMSTTLYLDFMDYEYYKGFLRKEEEEEKIIDKKEYTIDEIPIVEEVKNEYSLITFENNSSRYVTFPDLCLKSSKILINGSNLNNTNGLCVDGDLVVATKGFVELKVFHTYENRNKNPESAGLTNVTFHQYGMHGESSLKEESLVFFSIPYSNLWTVKIDGKEVEYIKGYNSFLVVKIPEGEHFITIEYGTKYYVYGGYVSLFTALIVFLYIIKRAN